MSVQLRVGGRYRLTDGSKIGPMTEDHSLGLRYRFQHNGSFYSDQGERFRGNGPNVAEELPAETSPEEPPASVAVVEREGDYAVLRDILDEAFAQAASGKGQERHANGQRFEDQPILRIAQEEGAGFLTGQAKKKITEARGMVERRQYGAAEREFLGAIVYIAARIHLLRQMKGSGA